MRRFWTVLVDIKFQEGLAKVFRTSRIRCVSVTLIVSVFDPLFYIWTDCDNTVPYVQCGIQRILHESSCQTRATIVFFYNSFNEDALLGSIGGFVATLDFTSRCCTITCPRALSVLFVKFWSHITAPYDVPLLADFSEVSSTRRVVRVPVVVPADRTGSHHIGETQYRRSRQGRQRARGQHRPQNPSRSGNVRAI